MIEEALDSPGFWLLGCGGTIAIVAGWIMARNMELEMLPLWQLVTLIVVVWVASAFFAAKG